MVWDLRSVRIVGPGVVLCIPHDSDAYEEGLWGREESKVGREFPVEKESRVIKAQERPIKRWKIVGDR